jgi:exopolyphosphatase/guanosine-5'-triphosphate,3'-diphosphate pyrophosphatase
MKLAVIDLGTNTFNLLIAERGDRLRVLHSEEVGVFLGKGGIEKGVIAEDAFARGLEALRTLGAKAHAWGVTDITGFGTSALRNARNGQAFVERALAETGIPITIIPGEEEAGLILDGVRQAVPFGPHPQLVMDIGGGSIEFILATDKALMWKQSFELGVTRLRDRFAPSDPITLEEQFRIAEHLDARLEPLWAVIDRHAPHVLVGSAGSFDTLAAMIDAERGGNIGPEAITLAFTALEFDLLKERLMPMDHAERARVPGLPAYRVDTIPLAMIAIERVLVAGAIRELRWSRYALKEGAAARSFAQR